MFCEYNFQIKDTNNNKNSNNGNVKPPACTVTAFRTPANIITIIMTIFIPNVYCVYYYYQRNVLRIYHWLNVAVLILVFFRHSTNTNRWYWLLFAVASTQRALLCFAACFFSVHHHTFYLSVVRDRLLPLYNLFPSSQVPQC